MHKRTSLTHCTSCAISYSSSLLLLFSLTLSLSLSLSLSCAFVKQRDDEWHQSPSYTSEEKEKIYSCPFLGQGDARESK